MYIDSISLLFVGFQVGLAGEGSQVDFEVGRRGVVARRDADDALDARGRRQARALHGERRRGDARDGDGDDAGLRREAVGREEHGAADGGRVGHGDAGQGLVHHHDLQRELGGLFGNVCVLMKRKTDGDWRVDWNGD